VHGQRGREAFVYGMQYILHCSSYILYNLYVLLVGKPSMGVGRGVGFQYPQKKPVPFGVGMGVCRVWVRV
jgi:hypothetical protein